MQAEVYEKLYSFKTNQKNGSINSKVEKMEELSEKLNNEENSIKIKYYLIKAIISSINFLVVEEMEKKRLKKSLARILNCNEKDIVYDENELRLNKGAKYIAGSIRYNASIDKESLINKKVILGDLDIRSLRDTSCLKNLELVGGDLFMGEDAYLPNLRFVFGKQVIETMKNKIAIKK